METQVPFPKFVELLQARGVSAAGTSFIKDAPGAWAALTEAERLELLEALEIDAAPADVAIRIGKKPGSTKSLENVLVILSWPDALALPPGPQEAPPAGGSAPPPPPRSDAPMNALVVAEDAPQPPPTPPADAPAEAPAAEAAEPPADEEPKKKGKKGIFGRFGAGKEEEPEKPDGPVTVIPPITDPDLEQVEVYPVQEPYAYVRILHHKTQHEHLYETIEPQLSDREKTILQFIEDTIVDIIEVGLADLSPEGSAELLRKHFDEVIYDYSVVLSPLSREKIMYYILRDFLGFGILDPIMRDEFIEDVSCDGPGVPIFLYHRKYESIRSLTKFKDDNEADSYVIRMAQRSGKHVSIAEPLLDATLPDGSRLNATLSNEVTAGGSTFTIRKFKEEPFTVPDLVRFGTMNEELLAYWWLAVQNGASAIYAGGTASGKTTSLNAILLFIPPQMKIVSIEDTREINIPHENWIAGVTRSGFGPRDSHGRQAGEIDMFMLLKAALRQRPEYILVGEVRGQEATALFQAMATGHTAFGTMHADSAEAVIHRLESDPISIPRSLLEALDIVSIQIQTRIGDRRVRRTKELVEIVGLDPHTREILTNEVFSWSPASDKFEYSGVSYVLERIQMERNLSEHELREEFDRRKRIIRYMVKNNIRSLRDVGKIIATYYKDPDAVMALVDEDDAERFEQAAAAAAAPGAGGAAGNAASRGAASGAAAAGWAGGAKATCGGAAAAASAAGAAAGGASARAQAQAQAQAQARARAAEARQQQQQQRPADAPGDATELEALPPKRVEVTVRDERGPTELEVVPDEEDEDGAQ